MRNDLTGSGSGVHRAEAAAVCCTLVCQPYLRKSACICVLIIGPNCPALPAGQDGRSRVQ